MRGRLDPDAALAGGETLPDDDGDDDEGPWSGPGYDDDGDESAAQAAQHVEVRFDLVPVG